MPISSGLFLKMVDQQLSLLSEGAVSNKNDIADFGYLDFWDEAMTEQEALQSAREAAYEALDDDGFPFAEDDEL